MIHELSVGVRMQQALLREVGRLITNIVVTLLAVGHRGFHFSLYRLLHRIVSGDLALHHAYLSCRTEISALRVSDRLIYQLAI